MGLLVSRVISRSRFASHSACLRIPDHLVDLNLQSNGKLIFQDPFREFTGMEPSRSQNLKTGGLRMCRRKQDRLTAIDKPMLCDDLAREFVIAP